jgi:cyclophilin family peptidyl-prolyl cis-trans isomerase
MKFSTIVYTCLFFVFIISCVPPKTETLEKGELSLQDPLAQKLIDFAVAHQEDSLVTYLKHPNPNYRVLALKSFSAFKDTKYKNEIMSALADIDIDVSATAAYVIGQIGDTSHVAKLIAAFKGQDSVDVDNIHNHNVLEAIGKIGSATDATNIASVTTYRPNDSLLILGQMRAIYRFAYRGITPSASTETAIKYLKNRNISSNARLIAAHYLQRSKDIDLAPYANDIIAEIGKTNDVNIKMALMGSLGKAKVDTVQKQLVSYAYSKDDYRVRVNAIKSLNSFNTNGSVTDTVLELVTDPNPHVASTAADYALGLLDFGRVGQLGLKAGQASHWLVKAKLLQAQMKNTTLAMTNTKTVIHESVNTQLKASSNPFEKAELIKVLGQDPYQYANIVGLTAPTPNEKVAKVDALNLIINHRDFVRAYKGNYIKVKREILYYLAGQIREGDPGVVASATTHLLSPANEAKLLLKDTTFIEVAIGKLKNPDDIEAINELKNLNKYLFGKEDKAEKLSGYKKIDYALLNAQKDSIEVVMKTTKGNITMMLYPRHAPQTVSSFLQLCNADYYDNKYFHRVVPNFVIQGGCPRGDGYGSLDFLLRSEVSQQYYDDQGYIGMASAGFDTEGCQIFITHSPTPHLDGRYTIFGKVLQGQDIVDLVEVNDKIIDAIIKN